MPSLFHDFASLQFCFCFLLFLDELKNYFGSYGKVADVQLKLDQETHKSRY